jgi:hypothetical protein
MANLTPEELNKQFEKLQRLATVLNKNLSAFNLRPVAEDAALIGELIDKWSDDLNDSLSSVNDLSSAFQSVTQEISKSNVGLASTKKTFNSLTSIAQQISYAQAGINKLSEKELTNLLKKSQQAKLDAQRNKTLLEQRKADLIAENQGNTISLEQKQKNRKEIEQINGAIKDNVSIINEESQSYKDLNTAINYRLQLEKQIVENLGITGALLKGAEGFLNKIGLGALSSAIGFKEINDELRTFAEKLEETEPNLSKAEKKQRVMREGFKLMGESIKESLNDPLTVASIAIAGLAKIAGLVADGFKRSQENTGALAKGLNITNKEAMELSKNMSASSFGSDRLFVSSKGLTETLVAINSELGTTVQLSNEELLTFTKLRETAGLTNEELMGIQKLSLANGKSFDENADSLLNQVSALNRSSGIYLNEKEVLKDISKLSAATTLSLGKNPKALAEAVATAKSLGMEMSKVDAIAGSLLNFEESIAHELEAELLLGKDINLEKARQAALNNDLATVAREISNQIGSSAEFSRMNRIQQEGLAQAVNMSREDLAETLFTQEALGGASGEEAKRRQDILDARIEEVGLARAQKEFEEGGLERMLEQATAADKMRATQEKLLESLTEMGAAIAPIIDTFAGIAGYIVSSKENMAVFKGVLIGVGTALAIVAANSVITAITGIFSTFSQIPFGVGIPLAIGAVAGLMTMISSFQKVGDVMSPADGVTRVSTKEGGLFELSPNDDFLAAPGAIKKMENAGATTIVQQSDNTETKRTNQLLESSVQALQELTKLSARPSVFQIGADEFFTSTSKYTYQVQ